jgi:2,4-dienoyl-CoA reductase-like NADH-dependent reductase (Old Yellow Enzyme family)
MSRQRREPTVRSQAARSGPRGVHPPPAALRRPLIVNNGFGQADANTAVRDGFADAVSFARHFVANPDLVSRFALGRELAAGDPATYYEGGARGYTDYPAAG